MHLQRQQWFDEVTATFRLAWPLVLSQLAAMALFTTDVVLMGWLSAEALAAGTLATAYLHPFMLLGIGILSIVGAFIAQSRGSRNIRAIRRYVRQGLWLTLCISFALILLLWPVETYLVLLGQSAENAAHAATYVHFALFSFPGILGMIVLRGFIASFEKTSVLLWITLVGVMLNALGAYALIFGHWGMPAMGLPGAGLATSLVHTVMFVITLVYVRTNPKLRRFHILYHFFRPDWEKFTRIFRLGLPLGLMLMAETGLFAAAALLMGLISTNALAAHAVALQCAGLAFMIPLGLSQATTIRVGLAHGARNRMAITRAGYVSLGIALGMMLCSSLLFLSMPDVLTRLFLDPHDPTKQAAFALAVGFIMIAALFQLADGVQVVMSAALRGMNDTKMPMIIALLSYWGIGFPTCLFLGLYTPLGGTGVWIGLATALLAAAVGLFGRFWLRGRLGLDSTPL